MKKITYLLSLFVLGMGVAVAKPIPEKTARRVAENFFRKNAAISINTIDLAYTEMGSKGLPAFYAFNINGNEGFVIVTADDAALPIIGYSTEGAFVVTDASSPISYWLNERKQEINNIQENNLVATSNISSAWNTYLNNSSNVVFGVNAVGVAPIVQSKWNQSPNYNALCPGGSVTGCVATTMSQIMRYWGYPKQGTGSSSYNHATYGLQSANYGAATYNWSNMPASLSGANSDVATINYHCGVSVEMNYSPSGSGAQVLGGYPSAQYSFVNYFKYNPAIINGKYRSSYNDASWINLMKADLDLGRPIQYVGYDPAPNGGGHTWVCDGYDQNNLLHMNWGWGGSSDGYFNVNSLNTSNGNYTNIHSALLGIVPKYTATSDAGVSSVFYPTGNYCSNTATFTPSIKVQNFGTSTLTSCVINYQIDGNTVQTQNWTGSLVTGQFEMVNLPNMNIGYGAHTLTCYTSNPNNATDGDANNDKSVTSFIVNGTGNLPIVEGFESATTLSGIWGSTKTIANGADWALATNTGASGSKSAFLNNLSNTANNVSNLENFATYNFSGVNSPSVSFKVAYQRKTTTQNDKLQLMVSTNCGSNWSTKWTKLGAGLATVTSTSSTSFTPTSTEFTTYTISIPSIANESSVLFRWVFTADANGPGNNLYLDDINILNAVGIETIENNLGLNLYPNPSNGVINLSMNLTEKHNISVTLTDMIGRAIESIPSKAYETGSNQIILGNKTNYQPGVYFVNIDVDGSRISKKIIVQ